MSSFTCIDSLKTTPFWCHRESWLERCGKAENFCCRRPKPWGSIQSIRKILYVYLQSAWWRVPGRARPLRLLFVTRVNGRVTNGNLHKTRHWRNSLPMKSLVEATPGGLRPQCWKAGGSSFTRTACVMWDSAVKFTDDGPFFFWTHITNGVHAVSCDVLTTEWKQWACRRFHHTLMGSPGSHWAYKAAARRSDQYGKAKFTPTIQLEMNS